MEKIQSPHQPILTFFQSWGKFSKTQGREQNAELTNYLEDARISRWHHREAGAGHTRSTGEGGSVRVVLVSELPIVPVKCSALVGQGDEGNSWLLSQNYFYPLHLRIYIQLGKSGLGTLASCCVLRGRPTE